MLNNQHTFILGIIAFLSSCTIDKEPPVAIISCFPTHGDTLTVFELNGSKSVDNNTFLKGLSFSYDFESDGRWDVKDLYEPLVLHKYIKPGQYLITMRVEDNCGNLDFDSIKIIVHGRNTASGLLYDSRDGQVYKTVLINHQWWMADNLRYGQWIMSSTEQSNNNIPEMYYYSDDSLRNATYGGLYSWDEAKNYDTSPKGLCPEGWHIPNKKEWVSLIENIDQWYAWQYYGPGGLSGLEIQNGKLCRREYNLIEWETEISTHWVNGYVVLDFLQEKAAYIFCYKPYWGELGLKTISTLYDGSDNIYVEASNYSTVRCVKDH